MIVMRIHRHTYPWTDHGYTWVESMWFEQNGERISPFVPAAGCCERLGNMPGGPVGCDLAYEIGRYAPNGYKIEKSETIHDDGYYRVGTVCITGPERRIA